MITSVLLRVIRTNEKFQSDLGIAEFFHGIYTLLLGRYLSTWKLMSFLIFLLWRVRTSKQLKPIWRSTLLREHGFWTQLVKGEECIFQIKISSPMSFAIAIHTGLTLFCWRLSQSKSCSIRSIAMTMQKQGRLRTGTSSCARAMAGKGRTHDNLSGSTTATAGNRCQSWEENTDFLIFISITMKNDLKLPTQQPSHYVII